MSSKAGSTVATALVSAPLGALAMMAVFGIPQFTSVVASPEAEEASFDEVSGAFDEGGGRARPVEDLFGDYGTSDEQYAGSRGSGLRDSRGDGRFPPLSRSGAAGRDSFPGAGGSGLRGQGMHGQDLRGQDPYAAGGAAAAPRAPRPGEAGLASANSIAAANNRAAIDTDPAQMGWPGSTSRTTPSSPGGPFATDPASQPQAEPQQPVPVRGPASTQPAPTDSLTWKQAVRKLNELGIDTYHLERGSQPETFLFVCLFSPGDDPRVTHRFEAEASEPLDAVADVLRQIEQWLQRRFGERREAVPFNMPLSITR